MRNSEIHIINFLIKNVDSSTSIIKVSNSAIVEFNNLTIQNSTTGISELLSITSSNEVRIKQLKVADIAELVLHITSSIVESESQLNLINCTEGILIESSIVKSISNSSFTNNGNIAQYKGGAIYIFNSQVSISNSTFTNNTAIAGGAIYFDCSSMDNWVLNLSKCTFDSNAAVEKGGAIYYSYNRPNLSGIVYLNNIAQYGKDIASYAVKIRVKESGTDIIEFNDVGSGVVYDHTIYLALVDYDNQVMNLNNVSQIIINPVNRTLSTILGTNAALLKSGIGTFDNIIAVAAPGMTNVQYRATSKAIDNTKITDVFGAPLSNNSIAMNFRYWRPGEIQQSNQEWRTWASGTYSLNWNETQCQNWPSDAVWLGEAKISVNPGSWRRSTNSTTILGCLYTDAWEGGYYPSNENPIKCAEGYSGNLCTECQFVNGTKYERVGDYQCEKCPNPVLNAVRVTGLLLLVFLFIMGLIIVNVRKTKESEMSVLLRIFTNYLQLITTSLSFGANYPDVLNNIFLPANKVGSSSETFLSFDCFVTDNEIKGPFPANVFLKLFLSALLPIIVFIIVAIVWLLVFCLKRKWVRSLKRNLVISFISIVFMLHPKLAEQSLSLFRWVEIDDGVSKVSLYTRMDWYSDEHLKWCFLISLPILIIWVITCPLIALLLLWKNINRGDNKVNQYFLILYQGLKRKNFYWEFINSLRKGLILTTFALLDSYQIFVAVIVLVITSRIQIALKPYKDPKNNEVELLAIVAGTLTLASGVIFMEEDAIEYINFIIFIIVLLINLKFLGEWVYLFLLWHSQKYKMAGKIAKCLAIVLLKNGNFNIRSNTFFP